MVSRKLVGVGGILVLAATASAFYYFAVLPKASRVSVVTQAGAPVAVNELVTNSESPWGRRTLIGLSAPAHGSARIVSPRKVEYQPAPSFFGQDTFAYTIKDWLGRTATGDVDVTVQLVPPTFLRRRGTASLSEMLQQPPTSIYGSSINVYAYVDNDRVAELDVAGHADSRTCLQASGLLANTLLTMGAHDNEFLVAGSSRIVGSDESASTASYDPDVKAWIGTVQAERISKILGKPVPPELEARRQELEKKPNVEAFRNGAAASAILSDVLRQFDEMSTSSGLILVHRLPADLPKRVRSRIEEAIASEESSILHFEDLVPAVSADGSPPEAVVFVPLLDSRSGAPLTLDLPLEEFSADKFAEAVQEHRDAMEVAMVGNARERLRVAETSLQDTRDQLNQCKQLNASQMNEVVHLNQTCTPDGCFHTIKGDSITRREYCAERLPQNESIAGDWQRSAQHILQSIDAERSKDGGVIDSVSHSSLVDAMLRDWVLPVRGSQAAFDYWRLKRRDAAWEAATRAIDALGVDRRIFSGENIAFPVSLSSGRLRIAPTLAIDLRRAVVIVDKRLGAIAVLDTWSERRAEPAPGAEGSGIPQALDPDTLRRSLETDPTREMSALFETWAAQLPRHTDEMAAHAARGADIIAARNRHGLEEALATVDPSISVEWPKIASYVSAVLELEDATVETKLRAALIVARGIVTFNAPGIDPWELLRKPMETAKRVGNDTKSPLYKAFEVDPRKVIAFLLKKASEEDADLVAQTLNQGRWLDHKSQRESRLLAVESTPASLLDLDVGLSNEIRGHLTLRAQVLEVLELLYENASLSAVAQKLNDVTAADGGGPSKERVKSIAKRVNERISQPLQQDVLFRAEVMADLQGLAESLLRQARDVNAIEGVHFAAEREALTARLSYEDGAYAQALARAFPEQLPVSLYHHALSWVVLDPELRGAFTALRATEEKDALLVSAHTTSGWKNVLRLQIPSGPDRTALATALRAIVGPGASDEAIADRILTLEVPLSPSLAQAIAALHEPAVRLAALKAVAFGCAAPAADLVPLPSDCSKSAQPRAGATEGVRSGAEMFRTPDLNDLLRIASARFQPLSPVGVGTK